MTRSWRCAPKSSYGGGPCHSSTPTSTMTPTSVNESGWPATSPSTGTSRTQPGEQKKISPTGWLAVRTTQPPTGFSRQVECLRRRLADGGWPADEIAAAIGAQFRLRPRAAYATSGTSVHQSPIPVRALYDDSFHFRFLLDLALPGIEYNDQGPLGTLTVRHPDGSAAQISPGGQTQQHGPRRLCDEIASIHETWDTTGHPRPDRYRFTIDPQHHTIWLDDPRSPHHWDL